MRHLCLPWIVGILKESTILLAAKQQNISLLIQWWGAGVVICMERGADLHMAQLMPLPLTVSCFSKISPG